jgi:hypothetical protein
MFVAADSYAIACSAGNSMGLHHYFEMMADDVRAYSWHAGLSFFPSF